MGNKTFHILSLLISLSALGLSIYTCDRHDKQLVEEKQVDAMIELVEYIQNNQMVFYLTTSVLMNPNQNDSTKLATLFELADSTYRKDLDRFPLQFFARTPIPLDFNKFIFNPLIPSEITQVLKEYLIRDGEYHYEFYPTFDHVILVEGHSRFDSLGVPSVPTQKEFIEHHKIDDFEKNDSIRYYRLNSHAFSNFGNFKRSNKKLYDAIRVWFNEHKIDNVNVLDI